MTKQNYSKSAPIDIPKNDPFEKFEELPFPVFSFSPSKDEEIDGYSSWVSSLETQSAIMGIDESFFGKK